MSGCTLVGAQRYRQRNCVQVLALLRILALNLLRCISFRSIRAGLITLAHDINQMLGWVGIRPSETDGYGADAVRSGDPGG